MKKRSFIIKKWSVRIFLAVAAIFGIASCGSQRNAVKDTPKEIIDENPREKVYGPPVNRGDLYRNQKEQEIQPLVYGPPRPLMPRDSSEQLKPKLRKDATPSGNVHPDKQ